MHERSRDDTDASAWEGLVLLLRAFAGLPNNWLVLGRNLIPVVGVYALGWPGSVTVLSYWWDGVCLLGLLIGAVALRTGVESSPNASRASLVLQGVVAWTFIFGMFGIPYWIAFNALELGPAAQDVLHETGRSIAFGFILLGDAFSGLHRGFLRIDDAELKRRAQAGLHTLVTRAALMLMLWDWGLSFLLVPFMALVLTGTEVWPAVLAEVRRINTSERSRGG